MDVIGVLFAVIILLIIIVIIKILRNYHAKADRSWREDNEDGSFTIFDKHGAGTLAITYEGGERYIDGHECRNADDMARWSVKRGFGQSLEQRLLQIEDELKKLNSDGGNELLKEWDERYATYRQLCVETGMYNWVIGDRTTFVPTSAQVEEEKRRRNTVVELYHEWQERLMDNQIVLDYLEKSPRKHCLKKQLMKDLTGTDPDRKKQVQTIYRRLLKSEIIGEKKKENGEIETRKIIRRTHAVKKLPSLPASTYHAELYANVRMRDVYKVDYTVSAPEELDRVNNVCFFTSKSSGERYATSLERCTCPAFCKGYACKHMLALALHLGYFDRSSVIR